MLDSAGTLDITQVTSPPFFQEYKDKGRTKFLDGEKSSTQATHFYVLSQPMLRRDAAQTPLQSEGVAPAMEVNDVVSLVESNETDLASANRSMLLVMKYEGVSSKENQARIDILTQRLRKLSPRVTASDIDALGGVIDTIETISASVARLKSKYGMK
jgi:hypothetical protein